MATPDAELKVRIDAQIEGLQKAFRQAANDTESFGDQTNNILARLAKNLNIARANYQLFGDKVQNNVSKLGAYKTALNSLLEAGFKPTSKEVLTVVSNIERLNKTINANAGRGGLSGFAKGSNEAAFALTNLGRVAQDAPFGFIGIQNNLNPLLESFQRLKAETGSSSLALKALKSSLVGPAGLGIAISVVTAALTYYAMWAQKNKKDTKELADANKELAESIKSISGVQQEGRKNASAELSQLQTLYSATQNLSIPQRDRLKIAKELIEKYPAYLQGMTSEGVLAGQAAGQYQKLTEAILAKGYAQAAEENRQKLINQQLNARVDKTREEIKLVNTLKQIDNANRGGLSRLGQEGEIALLGILGDEADNSRNKIKELNTTIKNGTSEIKLLDDVVQGLVKDFGTDVLFDPEKPKKLSKETKTVSDIFKALDIDLKQVSASVDGTFGDKSKERVTAFAKAIDELISIGIKPTDGIIKGLQDRLLNAQLPNVKNDAAKFAGVVISNVQKGFENSGNVEIFDIPRVTEKLISPFQQLNDYIGTQVFPQLQSGFDNFFTDILEKGSFSFAKLGSAILKTFTSVLASEATRGLLDLLNPAQTSLQKGGKGLFSLIAGLGAKSAIGGSGAASAAGATAASGGILLPLLGGLAAGGLIASLFKKKQATPAPAFNSYSNNTSPIGSDTFGGGSVVFQISGPNLIGVLNRAGAKLSRFNGTP